MRERTHITAAFILSSIKRETLYIILWLRFFFYQGDPSTTSALRHGQGATLHSIQLKMYSSAN